MCLVSCRNLPTSPLSRPAWGDVWRATRAPNKPGELSVPQPCQVFQHLSFVFKKSLNEILKSEETEEETHRQLPKLSRGHIGGSELRPADL